MKSLTPFAATSLTRDFSVKANLLKTSSQTLLVEFLIQGPLDLISWPSSHESLLNTSTLPPGNRKDELWKTTCLEAFFSSGIQNEDPYVEINCSPNGDWNAYSFQNYREGMMRSSEVSVHLKQKKSAEHEAQFWIEIQSAASLSIHSFGLAMVMGFTNGEKSYWALRHPASAADFHSKEAWEHSAQCTEQ